MSQPKHSSKNLMAKHFVQISFETISFKILIVIADKDKLKHNSYDFFKLQYSISNEQRMTEKKNFSHNRPYSLIS